MKHLKTSLLAFALLFSANALMAQEKYDYASVIYRPALKIVSVSINGTSYEETKVDKSEIQHPYFDANPLFKKVNELETEGWEIFSTGSPGESTTHVFYMRKKEQ